MDISRIFTFIDFLPPPFHLLRFAQSTIRALMVDVITSGRDTTPPEDFDMDPDTGFIPPRPLERLPAAFDSWEDALYVAKEVLILGDLDGEETTGMHVDGQRWRETLRKSPVISTVALRDNIRFLQRAHLVLTYLVQFYVHSTPPSENEGVKKVPASLAVPLVEVSRILGMAPVLTFADTVLWNCFPADPALPMSPTNMRFSHLFSGTDDEASFYAANAGVEFKGAEILRLIHDYNNLPDLADLTTISKLSRDLTRLAGMIDELREILEFVRAGCDPHTFYWAIRPWLNGSDANGPSSTGWVYEGVEDSKNLDLSGPSGAQSSVIHALDIFLDVDHKLAKRRFPAPSEANRKVDVGFMETMRRYMPGGHREFLRRLATSPRPLRPLAQQTPGLREPYDSAVSALKKFRDSHMRIAGRYIVTMSKSDPTSRPGCPVVAMMQRTEREMELDSVRGTGGTQLVPLLKAGSDAIFRLSI